MPILAVDKNGQIYATSSDRADGRGYGSHPECVTEGDLTLGSAYLKSQQAQRKDLIYGKRVQAMEDREDEKCQVRQQMGKANRRRHELVQNKMMEDPKLQRHLLRQAAMQGACECTEHVTSMSGYGLSSNGQTGWNGMSRDQKTIHHTLSGMGRNTAHRVDPNEARQMKMKQEAERILRLRAKR